MIQVENANKLACEWDEEELSSGSEVTLVRFDSDLMEEDNAQNLAEFLDMCEPDDRMHFIINRNKGEVVDMRNGAVIHKFPKINITRSQSVGVKTSEAKVGKIEAPSPTKLSKMPYTSIEMALPRNSNITKSISGADNVWDDYWDQSQKIHQKFLMSICQKDYHFLNELFNKKFNPYPININHKSFDSWTPLHFAALHGNIVALQTLLGFPELCLNALTNFKWSALHIASKNNKYDAAKLLLEAGIDPNFQDEDRNTALHLAVELGHKDMVRLIATNPNTDRQLRNNDGFLPKDLCTTGDIMKIFQPQIQAQTQRFGFLNTIARKNKQIERILLFTEGKGMECQTPVQTPVLTASRKIVPKDSKDSPRKNMSKKENIIRMYQLLKQKKPQDRVGIESFKFYRKIGEGAFGEVYIVKKGKSQRLYALKAIKKQKVLGTNIMRYIQTEKEVLSLIKHPFIVQLNYAFQTESHLFLVMDYCAGGDLGKFLEKKKKFSEEVVRYYAAQILLALQALHREKIIYRDMKPDNIVLDQDGHALLTDFGLSKKTANIDDINKSFCGTPAYLPLEIINKKGHNRMADWYQYGIVLYELYTGIPPFFAETKAQLYQNVRTGIIRFPRGTPEPFRDLIKRLLSQNPEKRLGFVNDAQAIKEHRWFEGIDWNQVYNRELPVPPIENKVTIGEPIKSKFIQERTDKYLISDWSFIAN